MSYKNKQLDKCTSITNSLLRDSSSSSTSGRSSSSWDKPSYSDSFPSEKPSNAGDDDASSLISSSSSPSRDGRHRGAFEVDLLSSEPEDFDESGHLFHMDIMKNSLSDISLPSTRRTITPKPKASQNLSFSRERVREIERHNQMLLQRIMTTKPTLKTQPTLQSKPKRSVTVINTSLNNSRTTSAAVNRKKKQRQIDIDNQVLRKKLEKIERTRRNAW